MYGSATASSVCRKNQTFDLPVKKKRDGTYKIPTGHIIYTCFTSDFLLKDADEWRPDCWKMIKERSDCYFMFFTKRIDRLESVLPSDWGDGYDNVIIGCTVENQDRADFRLPIFTSLPIKHRAVIVAPMLEKIDMSQYLNSSIEEVSVGGESGNGVRPLDYDWVLDIRRQCIEKSIPFTFHQTGARFIKDGKLYNIKRRFQHRQAKKAGIDFLTEKRTLPALPTENEEIQLSFGELE